jgi:hypothetical protein
VLAAKAAVIGLVAFAAGLAGASVAVPLGQRLLRSHGAYVWPVTSLTGLRVIVGTAAVIALCAVLAVAIGTVLRRGAAAVAAVIALIVVPYVLTVPIPVLPLGAADWLMRPRRSRLSRPSSSIPRSTTCTHLPTATTRWPRGPGARFCAPGSRWPWRSRTSR